MVQTFVRGQAAFNKVYLISADQITGPSCRLVLFIVGGGKNRHLAGSRFNITFKTFLFKQSHYYRDLFQRDASRHRELSGYGQTGHSN